MSTRPTPPPVEDLVGRFEEALLSLDRLAARRLLQESVGGRAPTELVEKLVAPALERIGAGWQNGTVALSQVYMSGRICEELVDSILPPADPRRKGQPRMAIATLEDHHGLGKRIVYSVLRASGLELLDYGHGVEVDDLVGRAAGDGVAILLISTLMLRSALKVKEVRARLNERGSSARIVVGGAPFLFDDRLWMEVGADAMGKSASDAVAIVGRMTGEQP